MLKLSFATYEAIRAHGEETYPHECCGVLLGKSTRSRQRGPLHRPRRQHPHRLRPQPLQHRPDRTGQDPARSPQAGPRHRRLLPLPPRPPRPVVQNRLRRSPLVRLLLRHHRRRPGQSRRSPTPSSSPAPAKTTSSSSTNPSRSGQRAEPGDTSILSTASQSISIILSGAKRIRRTARPQLATAPTVSATEPTM